MSNYMLIMKPVKKIKTVKKPTTTLVTAFDLMHKQDGTKK